MDEDSWFQDVTDSIEVGESLFRMKLPPLSRGSSFYQYSLSFSPLFLIAEEDDAALQQQAAGAHVHISITSKPSNVLGEHDVSFRDVAFLGEARLKLLLQLIDSLKHDSLTLTDFINGVFLLTQNRIYDDRQDGFLAFPSGADPFVTQNRVELYSHSTYTSVRRRRELHTLLQERRGQSDEIYKNAELAINQVLTEHEYLHTEIKIIPHQRADGVSSAVQGIQNAILPIYLQGSQSTHQQKRIVPGMRIVIDVVKTNLELVKNLVGSIYADETRTGSTGSDQTNIINYTNSHISLTTSERDLKLGEEIPPANSFFESIFSYQEKVQAQDIAMFTLTSLISIYFLVILSLQRNIRAGDTTNRFYDFLALVTQEECDVRPWLHIYKALRLLPVQPGDAVSAWISSTSSMPITLRDLREEILQRIEQIYGTGTTSTLAEFIRVVQQSPEAVEQQMIIEQYQNTDCLSSAETSPDGITVGIRRPNAVEAQLGLESRMMAALQSFYFLLNDPFDERTGLIDPFSINGYLKAAKSTYLKDFVELHRLGRGGYGEVVCANRLIENQKYAVKKVILDRRNFHTKTESATGFLEYIKSIMNEVRILSRLLHPFVVKYYYSWIETTSDTLQKDAETSSFSAMSSGCTTGTGDDCLGGSLSIMARALESPSSTTFSTPKFNKPPERNEIGKVVVFVQMEYCSHGCLSEFIQHCSTGAPLYPPLAQELTLTELLWRMTAQLASAVVYIHSKDIVHYDIKPANIFLDESYNVKLGDFGTSYTCKGPSDDQELLASDRSTFLYMAPELSAQHWMQSSLTDATQANLSITALRKQADMYSLGMTLLELWFLPTTSDSLGNLRILVQNKQLPSEFTETHPNVSALLYQLCDIHPLKRLTASALVEALSALNLPVVSTVLKGMPYSLNYQAEDRLSNTLNLLERAEGGLSQDDRDTLMSFLIKDSYCAELSLLYQLQGYKGIGNKLVSQTLLGYSQSCYKLRIEETLNQDGSSTKSKCNILVAANKHTPDQLDAFFEASGIDSFIEHILLLMGAVAIVLPPTTSYVSLRYDAQQHAALSGCSVFLTARLTQQLLTSINSTSQQNQRQGTNNLLSQGFSGNRLPIESTNSELTSEVSKSQSVPVEVKPECVDREGASIEELPSLLLLDLTKSISLTIQAFLSSLDRKSGVCCLTQNAKDNAQSETYSNQQAFNSTITSADTRCYFARHLYSSGEQCIVAFRNVLPIAPTQDANLVAASRIRAVEWALTILRVIFEVLNQHIIYSTAQKRTPDRKIMRLVDALSIDITIRFMKGAPLNQAQFKLAGERPNISKIHNLSHIDNVVFFQSLETTNSCSIISTTILLLEYLKTSIFADRIRVKFISAENYSFGANSISFACYLRDLWHTQPKSSNLDRSSKADDPHSKKRAFAYTTVDGVCDGSLTEGEVIDQQKHNTSMLLTGSFLVANPAEYSADQENVHSVPDDFVSLSFSPYAIQMAIRQYIKGSRVYPIVRPCNPSGLIARVYASYNEDVLLEEKVAILVKTIFIKQMLLLSGFHIIPECNESNKVRQFNYIDVIVDRMQFDFQWRGARRVHHIVDFSLCPEVSMADSIGRFLNFLEEQLSSDI